MKAAEEKKNRLFRRTTIMPMMFAALCCADAAATSVIVDFQPSRIIVVADSRANDSQFSASRDNQCKIAILGSKYVFAEMGLEGYTKANEQDHVPEWHGAEEAMKAYRGAHGSGLFEIAKHWGDVISQNFAKLYSANAALVRKSAGSDTLVVGVFAGRSDKGILTYYQDVVYLTSDNAVTFVVKEFDAQPTPYTLNVTTNELVVGHSERANEVSRLWREKSVAIAKSRKREAWLTFLIEQTARFDSGVGGSTSTARVTANGATWLSRGTCGTR